MICVYFLHMDYVNYVNFLSLWMDDFQIFSMNWNSIGIRFLNAGMNGDMVVEWRLFVVEKYVWNGAQKWLKWMRRESTRNNRNPALGETASGLSARVNRVVDRANRPLPAERTREARPLERTGHCLPKGRERSSSTRARELLEWLARAHLISLERT